MDKEYHAQKSREWYQRTKENNPERMAKCIMLCANCHRIEHDKLKYEAHEKRYK